MIWPFSKLRRKSEAAPDCLQIVREYGAVLEHASMGAGASRPLASLPYDKERIKAALIEAANLPGIDNEQLGFLGAGYVELASFQPEGGGASVFSQDVKNLSADELRQLANKISSAGRPELALMKVIEVETAQLLKEWQQKVRANA